MNDFIHLLRNPTAYSFADKPNAPPLLKISRDEVYLP